MEPIDPAEAAGRGAEFRESVTAPGVPTASLTLSGYTTADLTNGTLTTSYGTENDGTPYLYIHANS